MAATAPADLRNICLAGAGGSGKTTIAERLLFASGATKRMGSVDEGTTVSDFSAEEKHHKHSLVSSIMHFKFEGHEVNLIDTPGLVDFLGHAIACFPAVETIAVVIDAAKGIQSTTRKLMAVAAERQIPRMIIVNKIDDAQVDLEVLTEQIRETFGNICLPINLPIPGRSKVINVFEHDGNDAEGDQTEFSSVHEAHKRIVEQVIEVDEELTMEYLEKGEGAGFDPQKLHAAFEKALESAHLIPICYCSAKTGAGADDLIHVFASLCPSPIEVNPPEFEKSLADGTVADYNPKPDPAGHVVAHVFKVTNDSFVGKLGFFRVHQGIVKHKADLFIDDQKKPLRIGHLFKVQGKDHIEVHEVGPGEIAAVAKLEELKFNGVLHDSHEDDSVHLKPLPMPRPLYGLAIELKNHADETKFSGAAHKMTAEDPCFIVERVAATKQTVMRGLGDLHLRVALERFKNQYNIELITSPPKVAYKETITARADGHHRHKKQTGGAGQFGEVHLRVEPLPGDHAEGFEFVSEVVGGTVPRQYWPAVEKGVRQIMADGAIAGYPMTGVRCVLTDGKYHDVDSKEIAFITAGKKAFIEAVAKARPQLLEPFVNLEVTAPSRYMGDLAGHLSTKRGRVQSSDVIAGDACIVKAIAPLAELQNYANELKSMTGGAGTYMMEYSHDENTPSHIQAAVIAAFKPKADED
jgi:elongation factor G